MTITDKIITDKKSETVQSLIKSDTSIFATSSSSLILLRLTEAHLRAQSSLFFTEVSKAQCAQ